MNPQAIIAAIPWLRRIWRLLPPPLRVPALLVVAVVGVVQFVASRRTDDDQATSTQQDRDEDAALFS